MDWPSQGFLGVDRAGTLMLRPSDYLFVLIGGGMIAACGAVAIICALWTIQPLPGPETDDRMARPRPGSPSESIPISARALPGASSLTNRPERGQLTPGPDRPESPGSGGIDAYPTRGAGSPTGRTREHPRG